jgi:hypothetical protein
MLLLLGVAPPADVRKYVVYLIRATLTLPGSSVKTFG